jgi:tRNA (adenine57-N1/adenine58-N1)-methyltransferase
LSFREGDDVLLYLNQRKTYLVKIEKEKTFHTHKGFINLTEIIGKDHGYIILSSLGIKFLALKPILRDYIMKSKRSTQITYPKDIALIVMFSGIGSGDHVVEAGTGTGALTIALAHYIKPNGKIYSYELREKFIKNAEKNLKRALLHEYIEFKNKDITTGIDEKEIDAVILDLATPWLVIQHAYVALKNSGIIVSFSPTIDQVIKTVEELKENSFVDINSIECLMRRMQIERGKTRPQTLMTGHTGYITFARKSKRT